MERVTQVQVKIAEAIEREGPLAAAQLANAYGARPSNARRAADGMVVKGFLTYWNGRYSLTKRGRDDVLHSAAANTLHRLRRKEEQSQLEQPEETRAEADLFTVTHASGTFPWATVAPTVVPKADPIADEDYAEDVIDELFPMVTAAVALDIGGQLIVLDTDEAQALRRSLNKFFEGN
jgi:hypothetical protein